MVKVIVDEQKGIEVIHTMIESAHNHLKYAIPVPEIRWGGEFEEHSLKHSCFMFYSVALDALRNSDKVYFAGRNLALRYTPKDIIKLANSRGKLNCLTGVRRSQLEDVMDRFHDNGIGDPADILYKASLMLESEYKGDPRLIFKDMKDYDEIKDRLLKFYGIGHGKACLMVKNFARFGYLDLDNPFDMPIKIDRHAIKISVGNGVVNFKDCEPKEKVHINLFVNSLFDLIREINRDERVSPVLLDDVKWAIGNRLCIKKNFKVCDKHCSLNCNMLVKSNRSGTYLTIPSDVRLGDNYVSEKQMKLFSEEDKK